MDIYNRQWTEDETNGFCEILVNPVNNFLAILKRKALKKASTREVFEVIGKEFRKMLEDDAFEAKNENNFGGKRRKRRAIDTSTKRLQIKFNNLKQKWKQRRDSKMTGSEISATLDPYWYKLLDPFLSDTSHALNDVCDDVISMPVETYKREIKNGNGEDSNIDVISVVVSAYENSEQNPPNEDVEEIGERETKGKKRSSGRSDKEIEAISHLAASVNKLADVNSKRLKLDHEDRQALLNFRKEEAEKNRQHEMNLAKLYLQRFNLSQPGSDFCGCRRPINRSRQQEGPDTFDDI